MKSALVWLGVFAAAIASYTGYQHWQEQQWRLWIGQKIMPDIRYFCAEAGTEQAPCRQAVTQPSAELITLLRDYQFGGVVLFALNIETGPQLQQMNQALHQLDQPKLPFWIALDQEGGRVARLPEAIAPAFAGNMAIGATASQYQQQFATEVGVAQAQQLLSYGVNLNFTPSVDVNSNPLNPVINVRSFGDNPAQVTLLGNAVADALQQNGVLATFKHFPGHGDTAVDSHTGLPKVEHSKEQAFATDLYPFSQAIEAGIAQAVMTAHIQYPALDDSELMNSQGQHMMRPATLSRRILTDLLRQQLGFQGVVFTDALNMAAISDFFSPADAVLEAFAAGADVALMPLEIRSPADRDKLEQLYQQLINAIRDGRLSEAEMQASYQRIVKAKQLVKNQKPLPSPEQQLTSQLELEDRLVRASLTVVKGAERLPVSLNDKTLVLLMPDQEKCLQWQQALKQVAAYDAESRCLLPGATETPAYNAQTLVIAGIISPKQTAAEMGVIEDLLAAPSSVIPESQQLEFLQQQLQAAQAAGATNLVVALRAPYPLTALKQWSDIQLVSYGYSYQTRANGQQPALYPALVELLSGKFTSNATLPVQLPDTTVVTP